MKDVKHEINRQLRSNPKLLNRPEGHIWAGKTHKESFYKLKNGGKIVIEQKDVRENVWRSTTMAHALAKAAG